MRPELGVGDEIGPFLIEAEIGRGGMGVVYRCLDRKLNRQVAVKVISPALAADDDARKRFLREATVVASIDHPNVVPIYDSGESGGRLYLAMRYVEGTNVQELLETDGPMAPQRVASIIEQVASALDAAHDRGLVHRDVKPANILLTNLREREHAYLTDFGLAALSDGGTKLTRLGQAVGSVDYMAPEQIETGVVDQRADTYALGCVAFQMLTGQVPFARDSDIAKMWGHVNDPPPNASAIDADLPQGVDAVLARAMSKSPDDRYAATGESSHALSAALGTSVVAQDAAANVASAATARAAERPAADTVATEGAAAGTAAGAAAPLAVTSRRRLAPLLAILAAVVVVALVGGGIGAYFWVAHGPSTQTAVVAGPSGTSLPGPAATDAARRADFTPAYAAALLNIYLRAIGAADVTQICALNASRAPGNPNAVSPSQCHDRYQQAVINKAAYWQPGQAALWGAMSATSSGAVVNEKGNYVFDSNQNGLTFGSGKPADCATKDGCWFVVLYDQGDAYVERGVTPANAANPI